MDRSKILQVSSDGPNVNLAFLNQVKESRKDDLLDPLIDIGTCSLHTLHRSFQTGEKSSNWNMKKLLSSMYKIFDESPSRRADYERLTFASLSDYPLKFCAHRWIENAIVAKRAQTIWPKIVEVVNFWKGLPKSKQPGRGKPGQNTSFDYLAKAVDDPTIPLKLRFFEEIATSLNGFLVTFQTDNPMVPFLTESLDNVLRNLCIRFLRKDVLEEANSVYKLLKVDFANKVNQVSLDSVDLGFAIKHDIKVLRKNGKLSENKLRNLRSGALEFLSSLCSHFTEKSILKNRLVRSASCLSPKVMLEPSELSTKLLEKMLEILVGLKKLTSEAAMKAKQEYSKFLSHIVKPNTEHFNEFNQTTDRLDSFLWKYMGSVSNYQSLWSVAQIILVLSHGQATVERGFSENKMLLVENLDMESLVAQRLICDYMRRKKFEPHSFPISKSLMAHVKSSRQKYQQSLADKSQMKLTREKSEKEKNLISEIEEINTKVASLEKAISQLKDDSDKFAFEAEKKNDLAILSKSNALKRAALDKEGALGELKTKKAKLIELKERI